MNKFTFLLFIFLLLGCTGTPRLTYTYQCSTPEESKKLATWILKCIKDANPQSDEEPEDWISQCERTGKRILCEKTPAVEYKRCASCRWNTVPCTRITEPHLQAICPE